MAIKDGAYDHVYAKFTKKAWPALQKINAAGYVTFDCQDAATRGERSYLDGFMHKAVAVKFSDAFNTTGDLVAVVTPECGVWHACSRVPMKQERAIVENQIPLHFDQAIFTHFALQVGADEECMKSMVMVRCFDPVWGRGAEGLFAHVIHTVSDE